ncbi:unnamed protein product [Orchesella dallaii]|uniref:Uncharacterized protein n=1 Tax=Orchesella dallaii TaxID=48710 RepID=A0ABP1RAS9_9HEXA
MSAVWKRANDRFPIKLAAKKPNAEENSIMQGVKEELDMDESEPTSERREKVQEMRMNQHLSANCNNANESITTGNFETLPASYRIAWSSTSNLLMLAEVAINSSRFTSTASTSSSTLTVATNLLRIKHGKKEEVLEHVPTSEQREEENEVGMNQQLSATYNPNKIKTTGNSVTLPFSNQITSNSLKIAESTFNSSRSTSTPSLPVATKAPTKKIRSQEQIERRRARNKTYYERRKAKLEPQEEKERKLALQRAAYHRRKENRHKANYHEERVTTNQFTSNSLKIAEGTLNLFTCSTSATPTWSSILTAATIALTHERREKRRAQQRASYERSKKFKKVKSEEQKEKNMASGRACYHRRKAELKRLETKEEKERKLAQRRARLRKRKENEDQKHNNKARWKAWAELNKNGKRKY